MRNIITGGAGFIGYNLTKKLLENNEQVICIDNFISSDKSKIEDLIENPLFELLIHDVTEPLNIKADKIWHMACPASPTKYMEEPISTLKTNFMGTYNMLELAKESNAKFFFASTSEIYGDPIIHPQPENYNGSVNPFSSRACYGEGKRISETLCFEFKQKYNLDIKIARIFNCYGPYMSEKDGRVIVNFIRQALKKESLTIYGDGLQTRSFCFVDDVIEAIMKLMDTNYDEPLNVGHNEEISIKDLALKIKSKINNNSKIIHQDNRISEPKRRNPNISLAKEKLNWAPKITLNNGLDITIDFFKKKMVKSYSV